MSRSRIAELFEKLVQIIPGISGYQERENRRDSDKAVREKAAESLRACREKVLRMMAELSRSEAMTGFESIGVLGRLSTRMERVEDDLRFAPYGYAGFFDRVGVGLEELESLYETDLDLMEMAGGLPDMVGEQWFDYSVPQWVSDLEEVVESIDRTIMERKGIFDVKRVET